MPNTPTTTRHTHEPADDAATLDHIYSRFHPKRRRHFERTLPAYVLACFRCNGLCSKAEVRAAGKGRGPRAVEVCSAIEHATRERAGGR